MTNPPDYTEASKIFEQSMKDALAHLDKVNEEVLKAKEQAIDQEIAAKDEMLRIQRDAEKISEEAIQKHRKEYDLRVRNDTITEVVEKLLSVGRSSQEVKNWLDVSDEVIMHAHKFLGFENLEGIPANVYYDTQGRAGDVYFNWDGLVLKFPFEFGAGQTLATIDIPAAAFWEKETSIQLAQRPAVLEFIAKRIVRDQAPEHIYEITADTIRIIHQG